MLCRSTWKQSSPVSSGCLKAGWKFSCLLATHKNAVCCSSVSCAWMLFISEDVVLKVNDKEHRGRNVTDWKIDPDGKDVYQLPVMIDRYSKESCLFSDVDLKELNAKFGKKSAVIYGSDKLEEGGIVMSDYVLKLFGINEDEFDNLIGQHLELTVTDLDGGTAVLGPYKLTGIVDSDMFRLDADYYLAQIIFVDSKYRDDKNSVNASIRFYSHNFEDCTKLNDLFRTLGL